MYVKFEKVGQNSFSSLRPRTLWEKGRRGEGKEYGKWDYENMEGLL